MGIAKYATNQLNSTPSEIWTDPLFDSTVLEIFATFFVSACSADAPRLKRDARIFFLGFSPLYKALLRLCPCLSPSQSPQLGPFSLPLCHPLQIMWEGGKEGRREGGAKSIV